ncbi:MAG: hypothetical protein JNJ56_12630 [Ignavibacteria bacterium]|nr:hypothetical protein [Ignavibacteria bacterium]
MRQILKILSAILIIHATFNYSFAQLENLTFEVRTSNFVVYDTVTNTDPLTSGIYNKFTFDIYIQQTNTPQNDAEKMRFALGQYYWNLNLGSGFPGDTTGFLGYASVSYVPGSTTFSNPNAIPTSPTFLAKNASSDNLSLEGYPGGTARSSIRMNSNIALGSSSDVQVSTVYPGTRVGTFVVRKKVTVPNPGSWFPVWFSSIFYHMRWRQGPLNVNSVGPFSKMFAYNGLGGLSTEVTYKGTYLMDTSNVVSSYQQKILNLSVIPEGYYNYLSNRLIKKESVIIDLRQSVSPYAVVDSKAAIIDSVNFTGIFVFPNLNQANYYIIVKHKNCIETWSSSPVLINESSVYDFTSALNNAYGSNQKQVDTSPPRFGIISGNVNGDAIIDAADLSAVENDAEDGLTGNLLTDVTGDNFVDAIDISIVENNAFTGAIVITP